MFQAPPVILNLPCINSTEAAGINEWMKGFSSVSTGCNSLFQVIIYGCQVPRNLGKSNKSRVFVQNARVPIGMCHESTRPPKRGRLLVAQLCNSLAQRWTIWANAAMVALIKTCQVGPYVVY